jgi:hypothetical protein
MLAWSPILIQQIEIHALGFVLRKLQLNRHREAEVAAHRHPYTQLILYLAGEGIQRIRSEKVDARGGDLFIIPPRVPHGFSVDGHSRPLCLVLDYDTARKARRASHRRLPQHALNELHTLLARVPTKGRPTLSGLPGHHRRRRPVARTASNAGPGTAANPSPCLSACAAACENRLRLRRLPGSPDMLAMPFPDV